MAYEFTRENYIRDGVATLVKKEQVIDANGVMRENKEIKREVFTQEGGIVSKEFFSAYRSGINSQMKITIFRDDYEGEKIVEVYNDIEKKVCRYSVYRTYPVGDSVEIYLRDDAGEFD